MSTPDHHPPVEAVIKELREQSKRTQKSVRRLFWSMFIPFSFVFLVMALVALVLIPGLTPSSSQVGAAGTDDFLKLIVPIFAVALGYAAAVLGLKRLEQIDHEIGLVRAELMTQLASERRAAMDERQQFREAVDKRLEQFGQAFSVQAEAALARAIGTRQADIKRFMEDATAKIEEHVRAAEEVTAKSETQIKVIETRLAPYASLMEDVRDGKALVDIRTVGVAHERVAQLFAEGKADLALELVDGLLERQVQGSTADFHNLASELARQEHMPLAIGVLRQGIIRFPRNVDILADIVMFCSSVGNFDEADEAFKKLQEIDYSQWNWRAFVFSGDYLEETERFAEALAIYEEFRKCIPHDERGYSQPGNYYRRLGRYEEAIPLLEEGVEKCARASQCALLLSELLHEVGRYEDAIRAADRALESNADEQPSANQSAILWHRALAQDALVHKLLREGEETERVDQARLCRMVSDCIGDYLLAIDMPDAHNVFRYRGPQRIRILLSFAFRNGVPAEELQSALDKHEAATRLMGGHRSGDLGQRATLLKELSSLFDSDQSDDEETS